MRVIEFQRNAYPTALLLMGFPSHGLVGGIAANYLIEALKMDLVATVHGDLLPPTVSVVDGIAVSPIQIWAGAERCGLDGDCEQLLVVKSDILPPPEAYGALAEALLQWARVRGVRLAVALEGVNSEDEDAGFVNVAGVASPPARDLLGRGPFEILSDARLISGPSAAFLLKSNEIGVPVLSLFTNASPSYPDAAAAAKLLSVLDPLLPNIPIDPEPLEDRAARIEAAMKGDLAAQQRGMERLGGYGESMYG